MLCLLHFWYAACASSAFFCADNPSKSRVGKFSSPFGPNYQVVSLNGVNNHVVCPALEQPSSIFARTCSQDNIREMQSCKLVFWQPIWTGRKERNTILAGSICRQNSANVTNSTHMFCPVQTQQLGYTWLCSGQICQIKRHYWGGEGAMTQWEIYLTGSSFLQCTSLDSLDSLSHHLEGGGPEDWWIWFLQLDVQQVAGILLYHSSSCDMERFSEKSLAVQSNWANSLEKRPKDYYEKSGKNDNKIQ